MKRNIDKLIELVSNFEGFSKKMYKDAAGYATIGFGHKMKEGEALDRVISKDEALSLLKDDLVTAMDAVELFVVVPLTDPQFNALTSFVYNVGVSAFKKSTLLRKLNDGDYASVPKELIRWIHADGKILKGLVNRREAEGKLFSGIMK